MSTCVQCNRHNNEMATLFLETAITFCTVDNNGLHHSFDDKPARIHENGDLGWYRHGRSHRVGGPCYISENSAVRAWYINGSPHREDGPAYINTDLPRDPFQRYMWIWNNEPVETYDEELWPSKVIQYRTSWGELKPYKTAIVLEKINDFFWNILVGDKKIIVAEIKDYDEKKDEFNYYWTSESRFTKFR